MQSTIERAQRSKEFPWFNMSRELAQNRNLSWEARGVMAYILSKPDHWKVMVDDLRQGCGVKKVYGILKELRAAGYVSMYHIKSDQGQFVGVRYVVHEEPRAGFRQADFRQADSRDADNRQAERGDILDIREVERTEVEIKEKDLKPLIADAISGAASPLPLTGELDDMVATKRKLKPAPKVDEEPVTSDSEVLTHPLTQYLMKAFKVSRLNKGEMKLLKQPVMVTVPLKNGPAATSSILVYYDSVPGFKDFVEEVVPILASMQGSKLLNAIGFLRNTEKEGGRLPHWNEWERKNAQYIQPKDGPKEEKIRGVYEPFDLPEGVKIVQK